MFVSTFNKDQFKPPQEVLDRCECVKFPRRAWPIEKRLNMREVRIWALEHCESFVWWELEQHNDPYPVDREEVWLFYFYKSADATAFRLRWL